MLTNNPKAPLILLVEDDDNQAEMMKTSFQDAPEKYRLEIADTLSKAKAAIERQTPDLVLTDYRLPDGDGRDLVLVVRGKSPVVLMTSQGSEQIAVDAMKGGALDYIVKTVERLSGISRVAQRSLREWSLIQGRKLAEELLRIHQVELEEQNEELESKQAELDASRARYFDLYDLAPVGYLTFDKNGLILEANLTAANMLRVTRKNLLQNAMSKFVVREDEDIYYQKRKRLFESSAPQVWDMRMARKDGSAFWANLHATPAQNGEYWITFKDITDRKRAEQELREAKKAAEDANRAKSDFLATMSHEIRTPLGALLGNVELLEQSPLTPYQEECLDDCKTASRMLLQVINDVLDYSKIEAGKLELVNETFSISSMSRQLVRMFSATAKQKGLELKLSLADDLPEYISGDEQRLRQIISNLLGNAIKFTRQGGVLLEITVPHPPPNLPLERGGTKSLNALEGDGTKGLNALYFPTPLGPKGSFQGEGTKGNALDFLPPFQGEGTKGNALDFPPPLGPRGSFQGEGRGGDGVCGVDCVLHIIVSDTGIGIPPDQQEHIFERFAQVESFSTRTTTGTGLGLSICRSLLALMDGSITVSSVPGEGSIFTVLLPVVVCEAQAQVEVKAPPRRILFADDDEFGRAVMQKLLQRKGCKVTTVENGAELLDALQNEEFEIVLTDISMPDMEGTQAARIIRSGKRAGIDPHIPIIAMTAHAFSDDHERFLAAGINGYVAKPVNFEELYGVIEEMCSNGVNPINPQSPP